eukprot:1079323_1
MSMNTFTVLLAIVLSGASGLGSLVNASTKLASEEYKKELLVSGEIRAVEDAMGTPIPYEIRNLVGEFLPAREYYVIRMKSYIYRHQSYDLKDFMQSNCVVGVTNRNGSKTYRPTSVEFTDFATGQRINYAQTFRDIWVDFHLDTRGDGGVFRQVLADASEGIHKYVFEINCKGLCGNFVRMMFDAHSADKDFLQLRGGWKTVQAYSQAA